MKITVIGGSGFIGTNLVEILKDKHEVKIVDKQMSHFFPELTTIADICDLDALREAIDTTDIIVNLAAEHRDDVSPKSLYYDVNVQGTKNILQVMDEKAIKTIFFTSSVAAYGLNKENPNEEHPVDPFNDYGITKFAAEEVLREWYNKDQANNNLFILRPTVVFGPRNRGNVYNLLKQIASGKFMMIGKGQNKKSMAFVKNIVGFIQYAIEQNMYNGYHLFNYIDKPDLSTIELVKIAETATGKKLSPMQIPYALGYLGGLGFDVLAKITGKKLTISSVRIKKFCATTQFDSSKMLATGYKAPYTLSEGISETIKSILDGVEGVFESH
ncbi:MAG: UDP-N-acetylglucosamine 4-epimerase [Pseudopedobacter saltans]|uniref:UDP-N-acetylglucosamine 4-epimerase n=1 Tax=Pseudopedobacter saltans TaxID=151895 RepID=A0A2W5FAH0_9SPHI|nr:MAG: UDP-N-acetylglucosamine 4-epimerase [Pseudopedobacter saltans]